VVAGLVTSCSEDPKNPVDPDPTPPVTSAYKDLTLRDHVLINLEESYTEMNINEYKRLLGPGGEFTFFFSRTDIDSGFVQNTSWGRAAEESATSNMFNGVPSKDEGFVIDRIDLRLSYTPGEDIWIKDEGAPGNHDGEDWYERTVTYNMTITAGSDSFISTDIIASFIIKQFDVGGGDLRWRIIAWRDDIGLIFTSSHRHDGSPPAPAGAGTHDTTWGAVKSAFR